MKVCANCGAVIDNDALWCPQCGADAGKAVEREEPVVQPVPDPVVSSPAQPAFCSACGSPVLPGAAFCSACGAPLKANVVPPQQPDVQHVDVVEEEEIEIPQPRQRNTLGLVSFIMTMASLVVFLYSSYVGLGFLLCMIFCPVTLILSFIALFKKPRGFAVAAFIVSLVECLILVFLLCVFGLFYTLMAS